MGSGEAGAQAVSAGSSSASSLRFGYAPMTFLATWPCLKRISVGMLSISKFAAVCWFSSTLSLTILRSERSAAISSRTGATTRHGPHQGAQKSTSTGTSDSRTSAWKLVSVTSERVPAMSGSFEGVVPSLYKVKCGLGRAVAVAATYPPERSPGHSGLGGPVRRSAAQREDEVRRHVDLDE